MRIHHSLLTSTALTGLLFSACASDEPAERPPGNKEVLENASGSVVESDIRALLVGNQLEVLFPIERKASGNLEGTLTVKLVDVSDAEEPTLGESRATFMQSTVEQTHRVVVAGLPADIERAQTAAVILQWTAELAAGELRGKRSLYAAMGNLEVQLRGATEIPAGGSAPLRVIVRDPANLGAVEGARIEGVLEVEDGTRHTLFTGATDAKGTLAQAVSLPSGVEAGDLDVRVTHESAQAWGRTSVRVVHERKLHLGTDKTIYKPGQDIALRALALHRVTKQPLPAEEIVFEALDAKGNKVFKKRATTDEYGVASTSVPLDTRVNEGDWKLRAEIDGARYELDIPVVKYNLPKMKVVVTADAGYLLDGDTVSGDVQANYLFGRPVSGADITVMASLPNGQLLASANGRTDAEGAFDYNLALTRGIAGSAIEDGVPVTIRAQITDTANQSEEGAKVLPMVAAPIVVKAITEARALVPGARNVVFVTVSDPIGRPIVADLDVDVLGRRIQATTAADGVAEIGFIAAEGTTQASLQIRAVDGAARSHSRTVQLNADEAQGILVRSDKSVYTVSETATLEVSAPGANGRVFLDVYRGAEGVSTLEVELTNGTGEVQLPITDTMRGALLVDAYALAGKGVLIRGGQRLLVDPEDNLEITMETDRAQYSPGDDATVNVRVKDSAGTNKVAALGLTVVDEAAFALGGEPNDDLRSFFSIDSSILPSDLRVLGLAPTDLLELEASQRDRVARLMFASAKSTPAPGFELNSIREELPAVRASIEGKVRRDIVNMLKTLSPMVQNSSLDRNNLARHVRETARRLIDPFGKPYSVEGADDRNNFNLTLTTAGPDEISGNEDDVSVRQWFAWLLWGDDVDVDDDGNVRGGGFEAADAAAGGPAPPMAPAPNQRGNEQNANTTAPGAKQGPAGVKVRADFRETILVRPSLITDPTGAASVSFPVADSITSWRVSAHASSVDGKLGSGRFAFTTFQEFFLDFDVPLALTAGDEVELPAVVYNYLDTTQDVTVTLETSSSIAVLSSASQTVSLAPSEVRSVTFRIRAEEAGQHALTLRGTAGAIGDALVRVARVTPDGTPLDQTFSDKLEGTTQHTISVPADAVVNGTRVAITLTPGFASEAVAGTDALLKEPNGCFEQTTSTAWPNTLVTTYLRQTGQMTPEMEARAFDLVTRGYQRLLTFESPTGGFNWWGDNDPGNRVLSAIMLWHLKDLEAIIEIDEAVRDRTLAWLIDQQQGDGSWAAGDALHSGNEVLGENLVRSTAFIGWALGHTGWADAAVDKAAGWLRTNGQAEEDLYSIALAANALAVADPSGSMTNTLFSRLDDLKEEAGSGKVKWPTSAPSWTGAGGDVAAIETTGLVAYGLMKARAYPENAGQAMRFIVSNKDAVGTWYNTQATMNALRALLAAASPQGSNAEGDFVVTVNGTALPAVQVTQEDGDVYREIDITEHVRAGDNTVQLALNGTGDLTYRLTRVSYVPRPASVPAEGPFELTVSHDTTQPNVGEPVTTTAVATYTGTGQRDQVMVRIGRAPGFAPMTADLDQIVAAGLASRYELRETEVAFYVMGMRGGDPRTFTFRQIPTLSIEGEAPASSVYAYYEPQLKAEAAPTRFEVR